MGTYIRQEIPDPIVSDIMIPRMDGLNFVDWLNQPSENYIPLILLTTLSERPTNYTVWVWSRRLYDQTVRHENINATYHFHHT